MDTTPRREIRVHPLHPPRCVISMSEEPALGRSGRHEVPPTAGALIPYAMSEADIPSHPTAATYPVVG